MIPHNLTIYMDSAIELIVDCLTHALLLVLILLIVGIALCMLSLNVRLLYRSLHDGFEP
jgi:hypothetical protein